MNRFNRYTSLSLALALIIQPHAYGYVAVDHATVDDLLEHGLITDEQAQRLHNCVSLGGTGRRFDVHDDWLDMWGISRDTDGSL